MFGPNNSWKSINKRRWVIIWSSGRFFPTAYVLGFSMGNVAIHLNYCAFSPLSRRIIVPHSADMTLSQHETTAHMLLQKARSNQTSAALDWMDSAALTLSTHVAHASLKRHRMFRWRVIFGAQLNEYHFKAHVIRYCGFGAHCIFWIPPPSTEVGTVSFQITKEKILFETYLKEIYFWRTNDLYRMAAAVSA